MLSSGEGAGRIMHANGPLARPGKPSAVMAALLLALATVPGGCGPSLTALLDAMASNSSLYLDGLVNANMHYARTLLEWKRRFNASLPRVRSLGFDDAFIRCWNLYLSYCEAGFEAQIMNLLFLSFSRPGNKNLLGMRTSKFYQNQYS